MLSTIQEENTNSMQQFLQDKEAREAPLQKKGNSTQKNKHKNNPSGGSFGGLPGKENKKDNIHNPLWGNKK